MYVYINNCLRIPQFYENDYVGFENCRSKEENVLNYV